ncbi:MAG: NTP transferase domain-containing protein [Anaerolineae bacterium]|nr:NTP transferase domain-containing protein [Anaerolineae bacterium]
MALPPLPDMGEREGGEGLSSEGGQGRKRRGRREVDVALLVLGDQPQLQPAVVQALCRETLKVSQTFRVYIPTYEGRRGHPICLPRPFWEEVLALPWTASLRDFLRQHHADVVEVPVETPSILQDMDTREDYESLKGAFP